MIKKVLLTTIIAGSLISCKDMPEAYWVSTTIDEHWNVNQSLPALSENVEEVDILIDPNNTKQTIEGFGTCFNEMGWASLNKLETSVRDEIFNELFTPGIGANFTICRMPIAANDFALDWYSYNETEGDFNMDNFSIENDKKTLIPFIKSALRYQPDLKIWASPWCPPSWMKYNKHYASVSTSRMLRIWKKRLKEGESTYLSQVVDNGLAENKEGREGTDMFIQEDAYFKAYALYFSKFIDAYRQEGIDIFAVMPQNEFNSAQIYPSCCWTAKGLATFIGKYLGPSMSDKGVEVMFGTVERANLALVDTVLQDSDCAEYVTGVGFQWAGKDALPKVTSKYKDMKLYQTEQECGDGNNDWNGAFHSWDLMKHYLKNGVNVYEYWNTSLMAGGVSRWGWSQNSLVVVEENGKSFHYTPEYYVMKHVSHYVLPGAKRIETSGNYDDVLAFINEDKSIVVILGNPESTERKINFKVGDVVYSPLLKPNSINTFRIVG